MKVSLYENNAAVNSFEWGIEETSTVLCIGLETHSVAKQVSVVDGWVKIKILLMVQLKGLTAKLKLM